MTSDKVVIRRGLESEHSLVAQQKVKSGAGLESFTVSGCLSISPIFTYILWELHQGPGDRTLYPAQPSPFWQTFREPATT